MSEPGNVFVGFIGRAAVRFGPYLVSSRKRRRHRYRQWRTAQAREVEAIEVLGTNVRRDPATGLDFTVTKTRDKRTGATNENFSLCYGSGSGSATKAT